MTMSSQYSRAAATGGATGGYGGAPGGYGGEMGGGGYGGGGAGSADLASLLPRRPLSEEDRSNDWQFEIQWKVELRSPDGTPTTEEESPDVDTDIPGDEPLPDAPAPGSTAVLPQSDEDERGAL